MKKLDYKILVHFLPHKFSYAQKVRGDLILDSLKKGNLLDLGVGCGWLSRLAKERKFNVTGIDIADKVIKENNWFGRMTGKKIKIIKASLYKLPNGDDKFDSVVMSEVLEHLDYPLKALKEAKRVLKKDGKFALLIPGYSYRFVYDFLGQPLSSFLGYDTQIGNVFKKYNLKHDSRYEDAHRLKYNIPSLKKLLHEAGFKVEKVVNTEFFSPFVNTVFCNILGLKRNKIAFVEKIDTFLMNKVPLFLGSDWMFICTKL